MHTSSVIMGPVVTEKAERNKVQHTYTLRVQPSTTKVQLKEVLKRYYDVEVASVRVMRTVPKTRLVGQGKAMEKRHRTKRMIVRLTKKSRALDLSNFQVN